MSTADLEPETGVVTNPVRALQGLSQLATSPKPPLHAIQLILSSYSFSQSQDNRKRPHETDLGPGRSKKARGDEHNAGWPCELCSRSYSNKANLNRHIKSAHANKRRLVVMNVFECEECEYTGASQAALETHMDTHASSSEAKSPKYNCAFCNKERTSIYIHYGSHHKIDYPEQILFENGNVLVRSDINTDNGQAQWFLKEKEKMELYDDVTCRLCEATTRFDNREILADHYTLYHQVEPAKLDNLKKVFRAEKGAHLTGFMQSLKRKQSDISTIREKLPYRKEEKSETHNKSNLKTRLHVVFDCKECDQVYTSEALLEKHKNYKHGPKTEEKTKSVKYKCTFCRKDVAQIYKHYGNVHNIEYPEQMLFDNGNVLVRADINTNGGQAPWFLREKEKAESRYTLSTCRLCETEYGKTALLEKHYLTGHKVESHVLNSLSNLRCLFRADKGAHLADLPASRATKRQQRVMSQTSSRPLNKTGRKSNAVGAGALAEQKSVIEEYAAGLIMYQCEECGVAATTCDASIEHAQLHHLLGGYKPIPLTCDICSFAFEAQCFADHTMHHLSRDQYKIVKFRPSKLLDDWSEMFQGLSESHANRIKASSTYQYTRRVKMNSKEAAGIPLYQCGKCELYVRPRNVEGHCYSKTSCVDSQALGHFCSDCEIYFYSCAGLTDHEKEHRKYGNDCFRKVTFNCREDEPINRALQNLQKETVEETPVKTQDKNNQTIKIIENVVVSRFCSECKMSILGSEYEAHAATHQLENAAFECESSPGIEDHVHQEQNCLNSDKNAAEVTPQNAVMETEGNNVGGVVEQWNSDSDSCPRLRASSCVVHVDVHIQNVGIKDVLQSNQIVMTNTSVGEISATGDVQNVNNHSEVDLSSQLQDITFEEFSENMTSELKREIEHLGFTELGIGINQLTYIPDNLLEALENDERDSKSIHNDSDNKSENISQDLFLTNVTRIGNESRGTSPDIFNATTQNIFNATAQNGVHDVENNINLSNTRANQITNNVIEMSGATDKENGANTTYESIFQNDKESNSRPSSRVILNRMLSDDETA